MIEHGIVKCEQDRSTLIGTLKERKFPFKIVIQDVYPVRSLDQNAYYWFIINVISYCIGDDIIKTHEDYKKKFLYGYWPDKNGQWSMRVKSTSELSTVEMSEYTERIRIDALQMGIKTPNPNEIISNED